MDGRRFDDWTRELSTGAASRRSALRLAAGVAVSALPTWLGATKVDAACAAHGRPCKGDGGCCSGFCEKHGKCAKRGKPTGKCRCRCPVGTTPCAAKSCCGPSQTCQGGQCLGDCVPNCAGRTCGPDGCGGSCGDCDGGQACQVDGSCACQAAAPHFCGGTCRECCINDDCGRFSGKVCDHSQGSVCICANGNHDCGGGLCVTCCASEHCARFFTGSHYHCTTDGVCVCDEGYTFCNGAEAFSCTDIRTDNVNCGACSSSCPPSATCIGGICVNP